MVQLRCRTRGESSPQGKPRVYFSCNEQDFSACFEAISKEILDNSNCAVYYYEPTDPVTMDDDFYLNLSQMQLLVIPVTERFLSQSSRARDVEFSYAVAHHIPVLPLMQEPELETLFNAVCGELQFLDKNNTDDTAIRYADKLKKFLESVLVGDELAQRVRQAFDAYIFLSYRKKDRKYAQELMKLIHRNPQCRDIAIWYDEFLVPGENFNASIREALEKSDLFVLTVTPNLVNEINYIMTTEYPMARAGGKPVLPAEMEKTDRDALRQNYAGIPDVVSPADEAVFTKQLLAPLQSLALRENSDDPLHNYLIGLAYLSGIDVEVDHTYAVKMITSAAEAGLVEAMEKLAVMYEIGEGVGVDYEASIQWRITFVNALRQRYDSSGEEEACYAYVDAVKRLVRHLDHLGRSGYALDVALEMADVLPGLLCQSRAEGTLFNVTVDKLYYVTEGYHVVSALCLDIGEYALAASYYEITCSCAEMLKKASGALWSYILLADCYRERGKVATWTGNYGQGQICYQKAVEILESAARETDQQEAWEQLSKVCDRISFDYDYNDVEARAPWLQKSAEALEYLYEKYGDPRMETKLTETYGNIANLYSKNGYQEESRYWMQKIQGVLAGKIRENDPSANPLKMCQDLIQMAEASVDAGNLDNAMQWYRRALSLAGDYPADKDRARVADIEANCYAGMGTVWQKLGYQEKAQRCWEKAITIREYLAVSVPSKEALETLCESYMTIAELYEKSGCPVQQRACLIKEADTILQIMQYGPNIVFNEDILVQTYKEIAGLYMAEDNEAQAMQWYEKGFSVLKRCMEMDDNQGVQTIALAGAYASVGEAFRTCQKYDKAVLWYNKALELLIALLEGKPLQYGYKELGSVARRLGEVYIAQKKYAKAKESVFLAYRANEWLLKEDVSVFLVEDTAHLCESMVMLCQEMNAPEEAARWLEELLKRIAEVERRGAQYWERRNLVATCEKLAELFKKKGDWISAKIWHYRLLELCLKRNKANDNMATKKDLANAYHQLGDTCKAMEMYDEAAKWYKASFETAEILCAQRDEPELRRFAADCCKSLGDIFNTLKQFDKAEFWCTKAVDGYMELAKRTQKLSDYERIAEASYKLGVLTKSLQKLRSARNIYSKLAELCPKEPRYKQNADMINTILKKYFNT